jgi:L-fuconolactonase
VIVDAHQHFWDPARGDYSWLKPDSPLHRPYGTNDLRPLLIQTGVDATILVQAAPTAAETDFMLDIARRTPWVLGVVGWIDLAAPDAASEVRRRAADPLLLGVRPMLQDLADPDWILQRALDPALNAIAAEGLVFDALILSHQIAAITELATRHPQLAIVLDHAAKPCFGNPGKMEQWRTDLAVLAACPNVSCKISGLLTELQSGGGRAEIEDAVGLLFALFGRDRLLWGSDWPVLTLAGDYQNWFEMARQAIAGCDSSAVRAVMGDNAVRIYRPQRRR